MSEHLFLLTTPGKDYPSLSGKLFSTSAFCAYVGCFLSCILPGAEHLPCSQKGKAHVTAPCALCQPHNLHEHKRVSSLLVSTAQAQVLKHDLVISRWQKPPSLLPHLACTARATVNIATSLSLATHSSGNILLGLRF